MSHHALQCSLSKLLVLVVVAVNSSLTLISFDHICMDIGVLSLTLYGEETLTNSI